ncbi:MAG: GNAT family N-acetyltransferase [Bacteroidetes bacterium]|nr:GNAT family N-acetyltransferase [Bacteroidota bacterium]
MTIIEVNNKKTIREFLEVPAIIYKNDPYWVRPLDHEVESIFDQKINSFFTHGEAIRWVMKDDNGALTGRVAAFINKNKAFTFPQPTGGMGFFECTDNRDAAFLLFDTCRNWLEARGMQAMDGPVNFGENDVNWGLLVDGFIHPGLGMNYNPPYYREFFESYGFKFYFEQVSNHLDLTKPFPERFWKIAEWVRNKPENKFLHFTYKETAKFIQDLKEIYDDAWAFHESFTPLEEKLLMNTLKKSRPFLDEEMIWFAYHNGEPAAFLIMFPDVNQILKHLNGKLHLWNQLKFLYLKKKKTITRARIVIMGVKPKFQRHGLESGIFWHLNEKMKKKPQFTELELSWVGDFNPKMRALHESVGAVFGKRHITYRKLFSGEIPEQRSTIIPVDTKEKALRNKQ